MGSARSEEPVTLKRQSNIKKSLETLNVRVTRLGYISLAALFIGGLILILTSLNVLTAPRTEREGKKYEEELPKPAERFRFGYRWSVQVWLTIVGVGFGLVSYGFFEAYVHLFDWWCSRKACSGLGLDYARYLNSLPRAPVVYGFRGFPAFACLRCFLVIMTTVASIGYKFAFTQVTVFWYEDLNADTLYHEPLVEYSPFEWLWVNDEPGGLNFGFAHLRDVHQKPPSQIIMMGKACSDGFFSFAGGGDGNITSREVVVVADMSEDQGNFTMSKDEHDWFRIQTLKKGWFNGTGEPAVVDYRVLEPGKVQVQWAPLGPWLTDEVSTEPGQVTHRLTYDMHYSVAEVRRQFNTDAKMCGVIPDCGIAPWYPFILAEGQVPFPTKANELFLPRMRNWIQALVADEESRALSGVSLIIRAIMYGWAVQDTLYNDTGEQIRILPASEQPFGPENDTLSERAGYYPFMNYPYYIGTRSQGVMGCYFLAVAAFMGVGILAILGTGFRIWLGPPELTSWTGQHVYLSRVGAISALDSQQVLSTGRQVAPVRLGRLWIPERHESEGYSGSGQEFKYGQKISETQDSSA